MQAPTQTHARTRGGLLRRLRRRDDQVDVESLSPSIFDSHPPQIIDIRPVTEPDLQTLYFRVEKLEAGVRLIVETMKRTYGDLSSSLETLTRQLDVADARAVVERIVAEETSPLTTSIRELVDTVQRFPHVMAAAMDDLGLRIDSGRWKLEKTLGEGLDELRELAATHLEGQDGSARAPLAPRPFELEPVEQQFGVTNQSG